ncbi:MAG: hypothetical protein HZR80_00960 [Candidatus Heimdallarchaeota archaeon]
MKKNMLYTYVLDHDLGFAPNPFFNYLTLAGCKPILSGKKGIRKSVTKDNLENNNVWIFANGGSALFLENYEYVNGELKKLNPNWRTQNRLMYAFQVNEVLTFDEYYNDPRFSQKKRIDSSSYIKVFGDNILHSPTKNSKQKANKYLMDPELEPTSSSCTKKKPSKEKNIPVDNVLISKENQYYYFGCFAPNILSDLQEHFKKGPGHKSPDDEKILSTILDKIKEVCPKPGFYGFPSFKKHPKKYVEFSRNKNYLCEIYQDCFNDEIKSMIKNWKEQLTKQEEFANQVFASINCF